MTKTILIRELLAAGEVGRAGKISGWVRTVRCGKGITFIQLNDGTSLAGIQVVILPELANFTDVSAVGTGAALAVEGELQPSPAAGQPFEFHASRIEIVGAADENYPLQKKRHSFEYLRSIAHLRPRTNTFGAVFRLRSALSLAVHRFFAERGFLYVHTPIITANDCEGAGEMFRVTTLDAGVKDETADFFGRRTGLTVSGQLEGELFAQAFSRIYTFGPTFRAENSNTPRHAAEFWMIEPEIAFADLAADAALAEEFLRYLCRFAVEECAADMAFFDEHVERGVIDKVRTVAESDFQVMEYSEAINRLQAAPVPFAYPVAWGLDLQTEHERYLTEQVVGGPVFVVNYPKEIKAFYMRENDDGRTVAAMDLLVPKVGELIGGSQREERLPCLEEKMRRAGIDPGALWWYLETRRWGSVPHAGFGLGFERLIMYLSGMENIRDVIPFPRTPRHADF